MKHFLKLLDCTTEEIYELLDLAATMKQYVKEGKEHHFLKGKTLGMIFEKSSTVPVFPLKQGCISWAAMRCLSVQGIPRLAEASPHRILHAS